MVLNGSGRGRRSGNERGLRLGVELVLSVGEFLLGRIQALLQVHDLVEHRIDLDGNALEELVDLGGIVAALGLGKTLGLDVCRGDSHLGSPFIVRVLKRDALANLQKYIQQQPLNET